MDEEYNKLLLKKKKSELIEYFQNKMRKKREQVFLLANKNNKQGQKIQELQIKLNECKNQFDKRLNIGKDKKVFIESVTSKGLIRTYTGYITRETPKHILINVVNFEGNWDYLVSKENIKKFEQIPKKQITGMKIFRGHVNKEWKKN